MATIEDEYKTGYTPEQLEQADQGPIQEEFPVHVKRLTNDSEEKLNHSLLHNAWIIVGRDRPAGLSSGYGRFATNKNRLLDGRKSSTIDIGVGRYSGDTPKQDQDGPKNNVVGNNIQLDAARIYISQKTDIDKNFLLDESGTLVESIAQSAIGLKADVLRFAARENIKLVANVGDPKNSYGERNRDVNQIYGIQLITGAGKQAVPPEEVQGIVKSENLRQMLESLINDLNTFIGLVGSFIQLQDQLNNAIANHTHQGFVQSSPLGTVFITASEDLAGAYFGKFLNQKANQIDVGIINCKTNIGVSLKKDYLTKTNSKKYIGSIYNKTN
jgi:hypothetical protein